MPLPNTAAGTAPIEEAWYPCQRHLHHSWGNALSERRQTNNSERWPNHYLDRQSPGIAFTLSRYN